MGGIWRIVRSSREYHAVKQMTGLANSFCLRFWPMFDTEESKRVQKQVWGEMIKELAPVADLSRYASGD